MYRRGSGDTSFHNLKLFPWFVPEGLDQMIKYSQITMQIFLMEQTNHSQFREANMVESLIWKLTMSKKVPVR
jgi:hypothetical protein